MNKNEMFRDGAEAAVMTLQIPAKYLKKARQLILNTFKTEKIEVSFIHSDPDGKDGKTFSFEEVFPEYHPGIALAGLRHREDLTQKQMAEKLGISQARLSEYERNKRRITIDMAKRIGEIFNISYKSLL